MMLKVKSVSIASTSLATTEPTLVVLSLFSSEAKDVGRLIKYRLVVLAIDGDLNRAVVGAAVAIANGIAERGTGSLTD